MAHRYEIRKKSWNIGEPDEVLAVCKNRDEISYELEILGFKDSKTRLDEYGTLLYYKGKNVIYVAYVRSD